MVIIGTQDLALTLGIGIVYNLGRSGLVRRLGELSRLQVRVNIRVPDVSQDFGSKEPTTDTELHSNIQECKIFQPI